MNTGIIVQARLGSKRFPRKTQAIVNGRQMYLAVLDRCLEIGPMVILAVPKGEYFCFMSPEMPPRYETTTGPEDDVLERYLIAANEYNLDLIMRITADCPLLRPDLCRKVLELYNEGGCSYAAIGWPQGGFPKGYGCEVFSRFTLQLANELAVDPSDREHVTPWMERNVRCKYLQNDKDESHLNYCVDTMEDLERIRLENKP
jgi:spore coat polysaccharide biosynthesis protein SpsF